MRRSRAARAAARRDAGVEPGVGVVEVGVRDHDVEGLARQRVGGARGGAAGRAPRPRCAGPACRAAARRRGPRRARTRARTRAPVPPRGKKTPPVPLEVVDQRVDGAGLERVAADQQGVEAERLAQALVAHEAGDACDRPSGRHAGGRAAAATRSHVPQVQERLCREPLVAGREHAPRCTRRSAGSRRRRRARGARSARAARSRRRRSRSGRRRAMQAVEGVHRQQVDESASRRPAEREELLERRAAR